MLPSSGVHNSVKTQRRDFKLCKDLDKHFINIVRKNYVITVTLDHFWMRLNLLEYTFFWDTRYIIIRNIEFRITWNTKTNDRELQSMMLLWIQVTMDVELVTYFAYNRSSANYNGHLLLILHPGLSNCWFLCWARSMRTGDTLL